MAIGMGAEFLVRLPAVPASSEDDPPPHETEPLERLEFVGHS